MKKSNDAGRRRRVRTVQLGENILDALADTPSTGTRELAAQLNTGKSIIHEVLEEQLLYRYYLQKLDELIPEEFPRRIQFENWLLDQQGTNPNPLLYLIINISSKRLINIWAGIIGNVLTGPFALPPRLNGEVYVEFL